ncbi:hypothetical protein LY76DRAFT_157580 [Colletotrichum caudatum]|nr:hypothetical protein LY76DRAFT_157580 [Colletotrichum caudatum]
MSLLSLSLTLTVKKFPSRRLSPAALTKGLRHMRERRHRKYLVACLRGCWHAMPCHARPGPFFLHDARARRGPHHHR